MPNKTLPPSLKRRVPAIMAAVLTLLFVALTAKNLDLVDTSYLTSLEWQSVDAKFRLRGERPGDQQIVIVGLDDKTLDKLGSARVFQRSNFATLVSKLSEAKPKAVG